MEIEKKKKNPFAVFDDLKRWKKHFKESEKSAGLEDIITYFHDLTRHEALEKIDDDLVLYERFKEAAGKMEYTAEQAVTFAKYFPEEHHYLGMYLTALLDKHIKKGETFTLSTKGMDQRLYYLGVRLEKGKRLVIEGHAGERLGYGLQGGEIVVNGDAGNELGFRMKSGKIHVHGDVGSLVGYFMESGRIDIDGSYFNLGSVLGGSIYCKGVEITPLIRD